MGPVNAVPVPDDSKAGTIDFYLGPSHFLPARIYCLPVLDDSRAGTIGFYLVHYDFHQDFFYAQADRTVSLACPSQGRHSPEVTPLSLGAGERWIWPGE